jgi:6-pyruvoyltetrahydropterin/6-carboxytetrahydropterin synthase
VSRVHLTRTVHFSAAHRYYRSDWTPERNREVFGACANEHGHGHNYSCAVTVAGPLSADTSMVIGLETLDGILRRQVLDPLDHQHLNHVVPEFSTGERIPTAEALAVYVWTRVAPRLPGGVDLVRVRIEEDAHLSAEYYGDTP